MYLSKLSNQELVSGLLLLRGSERETTLKILFHLIELDDRGIYRELGYSSLFDYCVRELRYSESSSVRRVTAARALRDNPELAELFLEGKVNLCTIATAAEGLRDKRTVVSEIVGKSKREVELLVAPVVAVIREKIKPVVLEEPATLFVPEAKKEQRYTIQFSVTKEVFEQYEQVKNQLSNKLGSKLSVEGVFTELLQKELNRKGRKSRKAANPDSRYVPENLKHEVRERDSHQCAFVSDNGVRCSSKVYLQFDHIDAWGNGGKTEEPNLRLLCSCHNKLHAEQTFGQEFMAQFGSAGSKISKVTATSGC